MYKILFLLITTRQYRQWIVRLEENGKMKSTDFLGAIRMNKGFPFFSPMCIAMFM